MNYYRDKNRCMYYVQEDIDINDFYFSKWIDDRIYLILNSNINIKYIIYKFFNPSNGLTAWYDQGKLHRLDGPAIECDKDKYWYYHGQHIHCKSQDEFKKIISMKAFL